MSKVQDVCGRQGTSISAVKQGCDLPQVKALIACLIPFFLSILLQLMPLTLPI